MALILKKELFNLIRKVPKIVQHFCVSCFRSLSHDSKIDENWLVLKCRCCKEEEYIELPEPSRKLG